MPKISFDLFKLWKKTMFTGDGRKEYYFEKHHLSGASPSQYTDIIWPDNISNLGTRKSPHYGQERGLEQFPFFFVSRICALFPVICGTFFVTETAGCGSVFFRPRGLGVCLSRNSTNSFHNQLSIWKWNRVRNNNFKIVQKS